MGKKETEIEGWLLGPPRVCPSKGLRAKPRGLRSARFSVAHIPEAPGPTYSLGFTDGGGVLTCLPPRRARVLMNACVML